MLDQCEAGRLRAAFAAQTSSRPASPIAEGTAGSSVNLGDLSETGRAVQSLLSSTDSDAVEVALRGLPVTLRQRFDALSPLAYLPTLRAPLIAFGHDRDDLVIPVGESRRLRAALAD